MRKLLYTIFIVFYLNLIGSVLLVAAPVEIRITQPEDGAEVGLEELVRGYVTDVNVQVYVLLHPMRTNLWWVQRPPSSINNDGSWQTLCYFGTENQGRGEYFEIVAIVTKEKLNEGQVLRTIPSSPVRSNIVTVKRTR